MNFGDCYPKDGLRRLRTRLLSRVGKRRPRTFGWSIGGGFLTSSRMIFWPRILTHPIILNPLLHISRRLQTRLFKVRFTLLGDWKTPMVRCLCALSQWERLGEVSSIMFQMLMSCTCLRIAHSRKTQKSLVYALSVQRVLQAWWHPSAQVLVKSRHCGAWMRIYVQRVVMERLCAPLILTEPTGSAGRKTGSSKRF